MYSHGGQRRKARITNVCCPSNGIWDWAFRPWTSTWEYYWPIRRVRPWDIEAEHAVLSAERTRRLQQLAQTCGPTSPFAAAWLTYFLGQRMGDVMELTRADIFLVSTDQWKYMSLTFNKHKNSSRGKPPYSIALPVDSLAGQNMTKALTSTRHSEWDQNRIDGDD